ncbi:baseplate J/gp47 family protein [Dankookia sp. P2]|uniref:baseplate J/gp47 family protein n=1 Tax=Dankookia sp. P2 TaxID=3423955 RepID=UPI003D67B98A
MPLPLPRLDDRSFADLMREAETVIRRHSAQWTDLSPGDPGTTLLEAFAYLTDVMLYRLNRIPERVHVALLNLLGVSPRPPAAAEVTLRFTRSGNLDDELRLPAGQAVSDGSGSVAFTLMAPCVIPPGAETVEARAIHAERIEAELAGLGTGEGAQSLRLRRAPVLRDMPGLQALRIAVEAPPEDLRGGAADADGLRLGSKDFLVWTEVTSFVPLASGTRGFIADRASGLVTFAPLHGLGAPGAAPPLVPAKGREIRAWYWTGGGRAGNVAPGTLTALRPSIPNLTVTNPARAAGGEDGETLDATVSRAQVAAGQLQTAVTARDFERVALEAGGVARAHAFAQRERWSFAEPGVVEVQVVPAIADAAGPGEAVTLEVLQAHQVPDLLDRLRAALAARSPIGVRTVVGWTRCRPVGVTARVVVSTAEDTATVAARIAARINALLRPTGAWRFGRVLRASDIYEVILAEPGVRFAEGIRFQIESGPETAVRDIARDPANPQVVLAATEGGLFRSLDFGQKLVVAE